MLKMYINDPIRKEPLKTIEEIQESNIPKEPMHKIEIDFTRYKGKALSNVYYSIVNDYSFDFDGLHLIDNGVFLEFENGLWLNLMFNSAYGIFELSDENPNDLELEYTFQPVFYLDKWKAYHNQKLQSIETIRLYERFDFVSDVKLNFINETIYFCITEEITEYPHELVLNENSDWLTCVFSKKEIEKLGRYRVE